MFPILFFFQSPVTTYPVLCFFNGKKLNSQIPFAICVLLKYISYFKYLECKDNQQHFDRLLSQVAQKLPVI